MTGDARPLGLFQGYGVELEYMIVDRASLAVLPVSDRLIHAVAGEFVSELEADADVAWSNELVLHVIELKTNGPAPRLAGLAAAFQRNVARIEELLDPLGARLLPTGMHPWMDPHREMRLWPHEHSPVYETFDRIFGCKGHGWANLQSVHLNLPFADDAEFARLHAAVRLVLPILPALAASSPVADGRVAGARDHRLEVYRSNARRVPSVSGRVVPEPAWTRAAYEERILEPIYRDLAPLDPEGILRYEWANARGAIARFDRNTIEIRVIDVQECPAMDLALLGAVVATVKALVAERWLDLAGQQAFGIDALEPVLLAAIRDGEQAEIADPRYLAALGFPGPRARAAELWRHLAGELGREPGEGWWREPLQLVLDEGTLATRILRALGPEPSREALHRVYAELAACLAGGRPFHAARG